LAIGWIGNDWKESKYKLYREAGKLSGKAIAEADGVLLKNY